MKKARWVPKHRPINRLFPELIMEIMMHLDADSLRQARVAGRLFNDVIKRDDFWRRKIIQDFQITDAEYDSLRGSSGWDRYMRIQWHLRDGRFPYLHAAMLGLISMMERNYDDNNLKGAVRFFSDYLQPDELNSQMIKCNLRTLALYLAKFYQQDRVVQHLLEKYPNFISQTTRLKLGLAVDFTKINYLMYLESAIFSDDIQTVAKLIDDYKTDFASVRDEHNHHEGLDLHDIARSLKMSKYLMRRGVNFTLPVAIQAAKTVSFDRWMQYLSLDYGLPEGDSYLEIIDTIYQDEITELTNAIDLSIIAAVTTANLGFIQGISQLYTVGIVDMGLLSYHLNPATAKYGKDNEVRTNITKSLEIWNDNQPGYSRYERAIMEFVSLIRNNTDSDILKLYTMIPSSESLSEIQRKVTEIGTNRIKPIADVFHRLIKCFGNNRQRLTEIIGV